MKSHDSGSQVFEFLRVGRQSMGQLNVCSCQNKILFLELCIFKTCFMKLGTNRLVDLFVYLYGIRSVIIWHLNLIQKLLLCLLLVFTHNLDYRDQIVNILLNAVELLAHHRFDLFIFIFHDRV